MDLQNEKRKSCILFKSIVDAAEELDNDQALELLLTYAHYGLGETIDLDKCSKIVRLILLQNIEALNAADRRYQASKLNGPKGKENGGGVGRPRKNETPEEYQKRVEEWKRSKNPQETPKNPQVVSCTETPAKPQETPDNNPIKNPVIQKSASDTSQNPQKPLNVDVDAEVDAYAEVDVAGDAEAYMRSFLDNPVKDYRCLLDNVPYFINRNNSDLLDLQQNLKKKCNCDFTLNDIISSLQFLYKEKIGYRL